MQIHINGEAREFADELSLSHLIQLLELPSRRIAVELNREVIRRDDWESTILQDNDRIEIVHFVGGGVGFASGADWV